MKNRKRFLFIFCLFWVIGLLGSYFFASSFHALPERTVDYTYYFSQNQNAQTKSISYDSDEYENQNKSGCKPKETTNESMQKWLSKLKLKDIPKNFIEHLLKPQASVETCKPSPLKQDKA